MENLLNQIVFCEKYGITPNELLLLEIILIAQEGDDPVIVNEYFKSRICARGNTREMLQNLQDSGVILKSYKIPEKGTVLDVHSIPFNKNLIKDFYKSSFEMGKELFEAYPMFGIINGMNVGIRSVSKKFDTLEDFYRFYGKTIRNKPEAHSRILELVNWAKENNILTNTLANFVIDRKWDELEALKNGEIVNVNFDAVKLV